MAMISFMSWSILPHVLKVHVLWTQRDLNSNPTSGLGVWPEQALLNSLSLRKDTKNAQGGELLGELKHEQICSDPEVCHRDGVFRVTMPVSLRCHCPNATVVTTGGPHPHASSSITRRELPCPEFRAPLGRQQLMPAYRVQAFAQFGNTLKGHPNPTASSRTCQVNTRLPLPRPASHLLTVTGQ